MPRPSTRCPENPGIPPLFREIFKNAFLPYRDPETLRAFLKIIDEFTYDHSERLGDAFEYLLSVLGSQGDAGQFRTPRHIIDFIVAIIDPKKDETILDPACGTAGFLISSFKHILKSNTDEQGHSALTPDEKGRLAANFKGYDISPDMVRLSLVNLYLHGFADPHIFEYDTLTSEDRWNEYADVILANPPFMSPKGGIRPHNRFSVKSKRSEVLFVDYMAEHLTPSGRAGIIVPEGIIFQTQTAHKQLRKMLVENYLVAVISLPSGVFQPYSGVKTSILILDKVLARKTDRIGFFKVENDGFDLGAQRRLIDKNDLPQIAQGIEEYLNMDAQDIQDKENESSSSCPSMVKNLKKQGFAFIETKAKIAANGEYGLSGERYRENGRRDSAYPYVKLGSVARIVAGNPAPQGSKYFEDGKFPFVRTSDVGAVHRSDNFSGSADRVNQKAVDELRLRLMPPGTILFPKSGASTFLNHRVVISGAAYVSSHLASIICNEQKALPKYVYYLLCQVDAREITPDQAYPSLRLKEIGDIRIPLPPLEVQKEIVAEIEGYQKVIDGARAVVDNYRPHIPIEPAWPMVRLGDACELIKDGTHFSPKNTERGERLYLTSKNVRENHLDLSNASYVSEADHKPIYARCPVQRGDVLFIKDGANTGLAALNTLDEEFSLLSSVAVLRGKCGYLDNRFLCFFLNSTGGRSRMLSLMSGVAIRRLTLTKINQAEIALPPLEIQQAIVAEIEAEQSLVAANRELMKRFSKKIQAVIARVWR